MRALILLMLAGSLSGPAFGQTAPPANEAPKTMTGSWEISNADRDKTCAVTFRSEAAPKTEISSPGSKLDLEKNCAAALPFIKDAVAWNIGAKDVLRLVDSKGRPLLEFFEVESGMFEGERRGEGIFFMQSVAAVKKPAPTAAQVFGDWNVTRARRTICIMTLSDAAAADDGFIVMLKAGCDTLITRFNPNTWRLDKGELVLSSEKGDTWRFEEGDAPSTWRRIPERAGRVQLVRK
jgi:hypothetical protein